jgi:hypothetical protein
MVVAIVLEVYVEGRKPLCIARDAEIQPITTDFAHNAASR